MLPRSREFKPSFFFVCVCCLSEGGAEVSVNLNSLLCCHGNRLRGHQLKQWSSSKSVGSGNNIENTSNLLGYGIGLVIF